MSLSQIKAVIFFGGWVGAVCFAFTWLTGGNILAGASMAPIAALGLLGFEFGVRGLSAGSSPDQVQQSAPDDGLN